MMSIRSRLWWPAMALASSACASGIQVRTAMEPTASLDGLRTYAWRVGSGGVQGDVFLSQNPRIDERIRTVIDEELASVGFQRVESGRADLGVAYLAALERRLEVEEVDELFRYRRRVWTESWMEVREFDEGSLVLDLTAGDSGDPLWRGSASAELHSTDPGVRERTLREAVRAILAELPTTPSVDRR